MKFSNFVECFILTCLGSYPFLAVVNYKLHPMRDFRSCDDTCYFIRSFGTEALAATTPENLNLNCSKYEDCWLPLWTNKVSSSSIFVAVENGRNFSAACVARSTFWKNLLGKLVQVTLGGISVVTSKEHEFPSPAHVNQTICEKESVREKIDNHLNTGYTIPIYKVGIAGWTVMKIMHDWALLADVPEKKTLWLGIFSWIFQLVATCAAFSWAAAASEVFVSRVSAEHNYACYYQLQPTQTLAALGTPLFLLSLTHFKLKNLMLSVVNGDFLYYQAYDVPYRVVKATAAENPLLTMGLHGDPGFPAAPYQQLTFREMYRINVFTTMGMWCSYFGSQILFICPFFFGNLFLRMTEVAASHDFSWDLFGLIKLATLAAAGTLLIYPSVGVVLVGRHLIQNPLMRKCTRFCVGRILFVCFFVSTPVGAWAVFQAVACQEGLDGAEQRFEWYLFGISAGYLGLASLNVRYINPVKKLLESYRFFDEDETIRRYEQQGLLGPFGRHPSAQMLLDRSDSFTSHVEQVLEVFSSQPEKAKHLQPHDTKESHTQLHTSDDDSSSGTEGVAASWKTKHDSP